MIRAGVFAMDTIYNEVCVLVTAAFVLTLVPSFRQPERSLLSRRDQVTALVVFFFLGLVEARWRRLIALGQLGLLHHRRQAGHVLQVALANERRAPAGGAEQVDKRIGG